MPDFSKRSSKKELLDGDNIPFEQIRRNMQELEIINRYLGGHRITLNGISSLLNGEEKSNYPGKRLIICEIGCGGGDNLKAIAKWCSSGNIIAGFIGIDINSHCIAYAKENCKLLSAEWITSDYREANFKNKPDIIFSSLFCHHFQEDEIKHQITWMKENSRLGFFINDLHRHPLAYYSINLLTRLFSKSLLVKNDAPLSVLRGFKRKELEKIIAQFPGRFQLRWKWAFRWLVVAKIN